MYFCWLGPCFSTPKLRHCGQWQHIPEEWKVHWASWDGTAKNMLQKAVQTGSQFESGDDPGCHILVIGQGLTGLHATWHFCFISTCFMLLDNSFGCQIRLWSLQNPSTLMGDSNNEDGGDESDSDYDSCSSGSEKSSSSRRKRSSWFIQGNLFLMVICSPCHSPALCPASGIPVCRQAWLDVLGVGRERLLRCKNNFRGTDHRGLGDLAFSTVGWLVLFSKLQQWHYT